MRTKLFMKFGRVCQISFHFETIKLVEQEAADIPDPLFCGIMNKNSPK